MGEYAVPGACVVAVVFLNKRLESNVNRQFNTRFCSILRLTILLIDIFPTGPWTIGHRTRIIRPLHNNLSGPAVY